MPVPVGYAEVAIPGRHGSSAYGYVVFGVEVNIALSSPLVIADAVYDAFESTLLPLLDTSVLWGPAEVAVGTPAGDLSGTGSESDFGGADINSVPSNAAVLVTKQTNQGGRKGRGRMYWPWAANEADVTEPGIWNPASVAGFQVACDAFLQELVDIQLPMVLLHRDGSTPTEVVALIVQGQLATQRKRMRR